MPNGREYEQLAQALAEQLAATLGAETEICLHDADVPGRSKSNQIDVLWVGIIDGEQHRILVEAKNWAKPLNKGLVHLFRSVVDDIAIDGIPTTGVFVTPIGYQSGAQEVAKLYDVVLVELRPPTDRDLGNRIVRIDLNIEISTVSFNNVEFVWKVKPFEVTWPRFIADLALLVPPTGGDPVPVQHLLAQQLGETIDDQLAAAREHPEPCVVNLTEPHHVLIEEQVVGAATAVSGTPAVAVARSHSRIGPGREGIAHVAMNVFNGHTAWFTVDGRVHVIR